MRLLRYALWSLSLLAIVLAVLLYFLAWTETGLQLLVRLGISGLDNGSRIESIHGRLGQAVDIRGLKLVVGEDSYDIAELQLAWSPRQLLAGRLRIDHLSADQVTVRISDSAQNARAMDDFDFAYPRLPFGIQLVEADIRHLRVAGLTAEPLQARRIRLAARSGAEHLHIRRLRLVTGEMDATLAGEVGLGTHADSDLELRWTYATGGEVPLAANGRLAAQGRPGNYRVNAGFSLEGNDMPSGEWTLSGTGDLQHLSIERLNGRTLDGTVAGNGVLVWSPAWRWDATLTMEHINPGKHLPDWPGELSARVKVAGEALEETHRLSLLVEQLDGTLRGYRVAGHADLLMQDGALTVQRLRVNSGKNTLTASGTLAERWDMNARLDAPDLAALLPAWSGGLAATATIGGGAASPRIDAQLNGRTIAGPAVSLQTLQGDLALAAADTATQSASVHAGGLTLAGRDLEELQLDFSGTWQQHRLTLAAQGGEQQLDMRFNGGWRQQHWQGKLEQARWYLPQTGEWSLHQPVPLTLGPRRLEWADTCLTHERAELCIEAGGNPQGTLETAARLVRFPLTVLEEALDTPLQLTNLLDARLTASLQGGRVQGADLVVDVGAGDIRYRDLSLPAESRLEKGTLRASLDGKGVSATLRLELAGSDHLDAGLELPGYHPQTTAWRQQPLALEIAGDLKDLLIVQYLLEDTGSFQGALNIALQGSGTLGDPRIAGGARLSEATLAIDRLGIVLRQLDLDLRSRDDGLSLTGSAVSGEGRVELTGEIAVNDIASWEANVGLRGNRFEVIHQPEALVLVSPELQAKITPLEIHLGGKLHVPFARLRPEDLDRQTGRSSDVVIVDAKTSVAQDERWRVYSDVHLSLGDDVEIDGLGLTGDLLGAMHLNDRPQQETRAQGTISIEQGTYEAYGRKLEIERGRLLFSGGPVDNPGLDFRASRTVRDVTAGVRVSGTLETPELTLFSDPAMSESDIISYISFGRPMAQIGDGDGSAASQGLIAGGNLLGGMVGSAVGLEELGVEEGDTAEDAAMVLGTYLSPQLYVRYRTGLYESINEFHVIYEFTRNWGIRTISSVDQASAELRFSFER